MWGEVYQVVAETKEVYQNADAVLRLDGSTRTAILPTNEKTCQVLSMLAPFVLLFGRPPCTAMGFDVCTAYAVCTLCLPPPPRPTATARTTAAPAFGLYVALSGERGVIEFGRDSGSGGFVSVGEKHAMGNDCAGAISEGSYFSIESSQSMRVNHGCCRLSAGSSRRFETSLVSNLRSREWHCCYR